MQPGAEAEYNTPVGLSTAQKEETMRPDINRSKLAVLAAALALVVSGSAFGEDATAVLDSAAKAMGAATLKTIRYSGSGSAASFGQAYKPGMAWPKMNYPSYARLIDYDGAAFREEFVRSRAEPTGGGAAPLTGEQKVTQALSGTYAWNQTGPAPAPALAAVAGRTQDLWTTPHGVIKAAMKNKADLKWHTQGGKKLPIVSFSVPGAFSATAYLSADLLVERVESRASNPVLGDITTAATYSDYRDFGGVKFPTRIVQRQGGYMVLDLAVKEVQPNGPSDIQVPDNVRAVSTERVTAEQAAEGVWFVSGGSHNSVAIEMKDHVVLVESPLYDERALPVFEAVKKLVPGKPIRYVVNSHTHFDHAGGLRAAAAEGATIITQSQNKPYFEKAFIIPNRIAPDALAKSGKQPKIEGVGEKRVLTDGARTIEIHRLKNSVHTDTFLIVYLPREKLLIEADAYTPLPPDAQAPTPPNGNNVNLVENIEQLKLAVERILPLHGRMVPTAELYRTAGKGP